MQQAAKNKDMIDSNCDTKDMIDNTTYRKRAEQREPGAYKITALLEEAPEQTAALLEGRDLTHMSRKLVRSLLEEKWQLAAGTLDDFKDSINEQTTAEVARRLQRADAPLHVPHIRRLLPSRHFLPIRNFLAPIEAYQHRCSQTVGANRHNMPTADTAPGYPREHTRCP